MWLVLLLATLFFEVISLSKLFIENFKVYDFIEAEWLLLFEFKFY